jgi:hypothetical protein
MQHAYSLTIFQNITPRPLCFPPLKKIVLTSSCSFITQNLFFFFIFFYPSFPKHQDKSWLIAIEDLEVTTSDYGEGSVVVA